MDAFKETPCNEADCTFPDCKCWANEWKHSPQRMAKLIRMASEAATKLESEAKTLRECHTVNGKWSHSSDEVGAREQYDDWMRLVREIRTECA